jgi:hypothetical protein
VGPTRIYESRSLNRTAWGQNGLSAGSTPTRADLLRQGLENGHAARESYCSAAGPTIDGTGRLHTEKMQ